MSESPDSPRPSEPGASTAVPAPAPTAPDLPPPFRMIRLYLFTLPLMALLVAAYQVYGRLFGRMMPDVYFGPALLTNFALAFACGLVGLPAVLAVIYRWHRARRFTAGTLASVGALAGTAGVYALLNTSLPESRAPREIAEALVKSAFALAPWFAGAVLVLALLFRNRPDRSCAGA